MNRLQTAFDQLRAAGRKALLPYITGGYPNVDATAAILARLDPQTCVCAEVGIPFSDPIADGPVIQASFSAALDAHFKLDDLFAAVRQHRAAISVPLLAMVSYSVVYRRGPDAFVSAARTAGFDGLIVPDLAFEEAETLAACCHAQDCPLAMMIAPTTEPVRRKQIAALSEPFIYYQSLAGVTGERASLPADLRTHVAELRADTAKPVCVGFGISTPEHVRSVCSVADGAIIGSAIVRRLTESVTNGDAQTAIADAVLDKITHLATGLL